jgi:hypothetical protein
MKTLRSAKGLITTFGAIAALCTNIPAFAGAPTVQVLDQNWTFRLSPADERIPRPPAG